MSIRRAVIIGACLAIWALAVALVSALDAQAQFARPVCKDRGAMIETLRKKFGETQRSFGLQNDRRILELYASPDGTWTALLTMPSGRSCVVAAGEGWTELPPLPPGDET